MKGGSFVVLVVITAACVTPQRLPAQTVEFVPHFGLHMPVGLLMEGRDQSDNSLLRRRQLGSTSIGARLAVRPNARVSVEATAAYSPGLVAITDRDATVDLGGRVFLGNLKAMYRFARDDSGWQFYAGSGAGIVNRHGEGWNGTGGTTDFAVVFAGKARLGKLHSNKAFILAVEDYVTRAAFRGINASAEPRIHHDVVYSFGMAIPLTR
ncbi:MAG TPA: hypothetical protein VGD27_14730 [Longimicrobiales bacterium]